MAALANMSAWFSERVSGEGGNSFCADKIKLAYAPLQARTHAGASCLEGEGRGCMHSGCK